MPIIKFDGGLNTHLPFCLFPGLLATIRFTSTGLILNTPISSWFIVRGGTDWIALAAIEVCAFWPIGYEGIIPCEATPAHGNLLHSVFPSASSGRVVVARCFSSKDVQFRRFFLEVVQADLAGEVLDDFHQGAGEDGIAFEIEVWFAGVAVDSEFGVDGD